MGEIKWKGSKVYDDNVQFELDGMDWAVGVQVDEYPGCCGAICINSLEVTGYCGKKTTDLWGTHYEDTLEGKDATRKLNKVLTIKQKKEVMERIFKQVKRHDNKIKLFSLSTVMPGGIRSASSVNYSGTAPHVEGFSLYEFAKANGFRKSGECKSGTTGNQIALFTKSLDWD